MLYKKLYKNISVVALGTALFSLPVFTACESDVVDLEPVDKFSELTAYAAILLERPVYCKAKCAVKI